jgi:hypothetical protein
MGMEGGTADPAPPCRHGKRCRKIDKTHPLQRLRLAVSAMNTWYPTASRAWPIRCRCRPVEPGPGPWERPQNLFLSLVHAGVQPVQRGWRRRHNTNLCPSGRQARFIQADRFPAMRALQVQHLARGQLGQGLFQPRTPVHRKNAAGLLTKRTLGNIKTPECEKTEKSQGGGRYLSAAVGILFPPAPSAGFDGGGPLAAGRP